MKKLKKILVSLALAGRSRDRFEFAAELADKFDTELIVVNVINSRDVDAARTISAMGYEVDGEHYVEGVRKERERELMQVVESIPFPVEKLRAIIRVGNPVEELLKIIIEEDVDMVVMGPKGRTNLEHVLIGSVADKLFRKSPVTIVSYRDGEEAVRLRKRIQL